MIAEPVNLDDKKIKEVTHEVKSVTLNNEKKLNKNESMNKKERIRKNNYIFVSVIIYVIGIIVGSICYRIWCTDAIIHEEIIERFDLVSEAEKNEEEIFLDSIKNNVIIVIAYFVIGISVVGIPIIIIMCFYHGFSFAFVICTFLLKYGFVNGYSNIFEKFFPYYILKFIAIILLTSSSFKVGNNIIREKKDIKYETIRHFIVTLICSIFLLTSSFVENTVFKCL